MSDEPTVDAQLGHIDALVEKWAPEDESEFPLSMTRERREGKLVWWVCIHIKVKDQDDFTIESDHENLKIAMANAIHRLTRFRKAATEAALADYGFGIKYSKREIQ